MNKIIVNHGSFKVKEVELEHGTLTVGRAVDNDLKLDDSAVSSHHAKLVTFFNVTYIEDLNSTNGTLVNGRPVKKYTLHTGDIVLLGKHQLLFQGARLEETGGDSTIVMTAGEKNDALATAAEMKKTEVSAPKPYTPKPSKIPMKQDHKETVGRFHDNNSAQSRQPAAPMSGGFSGNAGYRETSAPSSSANALAQGGNHSAAEDNRNSNAIMESTSAVAAFTSNTPQSYAAHEEADGNEQQVLEKPAQKIDPKPSQADAPQIAKKPNPFMAAFPEDSADKIDINQVPAIGDVESDEKPALSTFGENSPSAAVSNPDTSSANIYNVQALSLAEASKNAKANFRANIPVDGDESLLIPAFAKKLNHPESAAKPAFSNVSKISEHTEEKISPEIEKLFAEEEKQKAKPVRKILEDPSVSMGDDFQGMTPVGINESNRISQYQRRAAASHGDIPAVGDRTLLKQIITGDREMSPSRNKFEVIQIVLGVVIFVIIALIAVANL